MSFVALLAVQPDCELRTSGAWGVSLLRSRPGSNEGDSRVAEGTR